MRRGVLPIVTALFMMCVTILRPAPAFAQQIVPPQHRAVTLGTVFGLGSSGFNLTLSYPTSPLLDGVLRVQSFSAGGVSSSVFWFGGRRHVRVNNPLADPYLLAAFVTSSGDSSYQATGRGGELFLGGGFALRSPRGVTLYGTAGVLTGGLVSGDIGLQFGRGERASAVIGVSGGFGSLPSSGPVWGGALYVGLGINF